MQKGDYPLIRMTRAVHTRLISFLERSRAKAEKRPRQAKKKLLKGVVSPCDAIELLLDFAEQEQIRKEQYARGRRKGREVKKTDVQHIEESRMVDEGCPNG